MDATVGYLIALLWLGWLAYWLYSARGAKANVRVESPASRLAHTVPLGVAAWMIFAQRLPGGFLSESLYPRDMRVELAGAVLVVAGLAYSLWARVFLGRNWSGEVTLKQDHELVRGGPYRQVRHPIYTGILLALVGSAIARDEWRGVLAVAIALAAIWRKLSIEERWMIGQFGDAYREYRRTTPALLPNPFRRREAADR